MHDYKITSKDGVDLGTYRAHDAKGALNRMARDAGCASFEAACNVTQADVNGWTESAYAFRSGGFALLVAIVEEPATS